MIYIQDGLKNCITTCEFRVQETVSSQVKETESSLVKETESSLVKETESHVVILFLLGLLLLGRGSSRRGICGGSSRGGGSSTTTAAGGHRGDLLNAFGQQGGDILAGQLGHNLANLLGIGIDSSGFQNLLNGLGVDISASEGNEQSCSSVAHFLAGLSKSLVEVNQAILS